MLIAFLLTFALPTDLLANEFIDALKNGKADFNMRLRSEYADYFSDTQKEGYSFTERIRLGYTTEHFNGFKFRFSIEDVRNASNQTYNSLVNGTTDRGVIADPTGTELDELNVTYTSGAVTVIAGRQVITLDDHRFIGHVGWRQFRQTFDAVTGVFTIDDNNTLILSNIWNITGILGPDVDDVETNVNVAHWSSSCLGESIGKLSIFAYLLDARSAMTANSDTYGARLAGKNAISDSLALSHTFSYANQTDAEGNPNTFSTDYFLAETKLVKNDAGFIGAGFESLGSDEMDGGGYASFQTPLATKHKFNGFADKFLRTPDGGLEDGYLYIGTTLPCKTKATLTYHQFRGQKGAIKNLGSETDLVISKKLNDNVNLMTKLAFYNGVDTNNDTHKAMMQMEISF